MVSTVGQKEFLVLDFAVPKLPRKSNMKRRTVLVIES